MTSGDFHLTIFCHTAVVKTESYNSLSFLNVQGPEKGGILLYLQFIKMNYATSRTSETKCSRSSGFHL